MPDEDREPSVAEEEEVERQELARRTQWEMQWTDVQRFLQSRGYMLRPRLRPDWVPSWKEKNLTSLQLFLTEDAILTPVRRQHPQDVPSSELTTRA